MTMTENDTWAQMAIDNGSATREQYDYFYSFPWWSTIPWGLAVFSGLAGMFCLLMRKRVAVDLLILSAVMALVSNSFLVLFLDWTEIMGTAALGMCGFVVLLAAGVAFYAKKMRDAGVLN
jgi:FtsH-binding integral membrane protein